MEKLNVFLTLIRLIIILFTKKNVILKHNGVDILDYPTKKGWYLAPFPMEKGRPFSADNLVTTSRHSFLKEDNFIHAMKAGEARWGNIKNKRDISWRLNIMLWAVSHSLRSWNKESIFIECGTGKGYMVSAICSYFNWDDAKPDFYLIDSFSPFVPDIKGQQIENSKTSFMYSKGDEEIREYFSKHKSIKILKGFIPEVLSELPDKNIGFLHIDLNSSIAEKAALDQLRYKLISGAIVLFDDYGGFGGENQAKVHESFANDLGGRLLTLPTGQAIYFHI